jgi:alpha-ketoglutarate-dependent taurine dioxygenase
MLVRASDRPPCDFRIEALPRCAGLVVESYDGRPLESLPQRQVETWLKEHGALILRGFCTEPGTEEFIRFSGRFSPHFSQYEGGGLQWKSLNREEVGGNNTVLTTTGGDFGFPIPLHAEMHYSGNPPRLLWFFCEKPPVDRGETLLADSRTMFAALSEETQAFFLRDPVKYSRRYGDGEWQASFRTDSFAQLESLCKAQKCALAIEPGGTVAIEYACSAVRRDEEGNACFVNNVLVISYFERALEAGLAEQYFPDLKKQASPVQVRQMCGSRIPDAILQELAEVAAEVAVPHSWEAGDVVLLDNFRALHGRNGSDDRVRNIYVRLGY